MVQQAALLAGASEQTHSAYGGYTPQLSHKVDRPLWSVVAFCGTHGCSWVYWVYWVYFIYSLDVDPSVNGSWSILEFGI